MEVGDVVQSRANQEKTTVSEFPRSLHALAENPHPKHVPSAHLKPLEFGSRKPRNQF